MLDAATSDLPNTPPGFRWPRV